MNKGGVQAWPGTPARPRASVVCEGGSGGRRCEWRAGLPGPKCSGDTGQCWRAPLPMLSFFLSFLFNLNSIGQHPAHR